MAGLLSNFQIGKNSLLNSQLGIQTASHNIANAENPNYARQTVVTTSNPAYPMHAGWLGTGANATAIVQERDQFLERQLLGSISSEADYSTRATNLAIAETYLADGGEGGISEALGDFWDAWDGLNQNPTGTSEKSLVYKAADTVAGTISGLQDNLDALGDEINTDIDNEITDLINPLLEKIANLNLQIRRVETPGYTANDLRDLRQEALNDLAEELPIQYQLESDGTATVTLDGVTLVSGESFVELFRPDPTGDPTNIDYQDSPASTGPPLGSGDLPALDGGGRLNGLVQSLNEIELNADSYLNRLNDFAAAFAAEVNATHGSAVFAIDVNGRIQLDAGFSTSSIQPENALAVSSLQDQDIVALSPPDGVRFSEYLSDLQQQVGLDYQEAVTETDFYAALQAELLARQQNVSGVSLEEEMLSIYQYQHLYEAAAKIISTTSEMLDTIMAAT